MIICIDTATKICSVALCDKSGVVAIKEDAGERSHASMLTVLIKELLKDAGAEMSDIEAVAVSKGPGSYTGLRIGVSVAKGIVYALSKPMISVSTPETMFNGMISVASAKYGADNETIYCPMIDARRMEVYYALYNSKGKNIKEVSAEIIDSDSFGEILNKNKMLFFGDGAEKFTDVIKHPNAIITDDYKISAGDMYPSVIKAFNNKVFEDVAYFEPYYLKEFITTVQRKNQLLK